MFERKRWHRLTAILLVLTMLFTSIPAMAFAESASSEEPDAGQDEIQYEEQTLSNTLILEESVSEENAVLEESTETTTIFDLGDGKKVAVFHGGDVRYKTEDGTFADYEPELVSIQEQESINGEELKGYLYENKTGDMKQYIPEVLNEETPLLMEKKGYSIKMTPMEEESLKTEVEVVKDETLTPYEEIEEEDLTAVYMAEDETYSYEYTSLSNGIKESIVLEEVPDSNVFSFRLETDGLIPVLDETQNVINLTDKHGGEIIAHIDKPFMNDASGEAYSEDLVYTLEEQEEGYYVVELEVSRKYLNDSERLYPVTIDPTTTWKGNSELSDAYVISGDYADINFYESDIRLMVAGKGLEGSYRTYMKILNLKSELEDMYVDSAYLTLYESGDCDPDQTIRFNRITESWSLSSITWNNKPTYYSSSSINSFTTDGKQYAAHKMTMTNTVRNYVNSTNNPNYGIVMRNVTSSPEFAEFYGSRTSLTSYRPKLVVTYYDKPTAPETVSMSRKITDEKYESSSYMKKGHNMYATWKGIESHNLSAVQYKIIAADDTTPDPTSVSSDGVNLTSYRSIGSTAASGTNVKIPYGSSLPAGKYKLYLRGKDAGGMYGAAKSKTFYADGDTPSLTGVKVEPGTTADSPTKNKNPKLTWTASDTYFSKVTITVTGGTEFTTTTSSGTKSVTLASSRFPEDKTYTIKVKVYDKAGKSTTKTLYYHVDTKGPNIKSLKTDPSTTASGKTNDITPTVKWSIEDEQLAKIQLYLGETLIYTPSSVSTTSVSIKSSRFPKSGTYKFTLKATDKAGNVSEKSVNYYVDIDAPGFKSLKVTPASSSLAKAHVSSPTITWTSAATDISKISYSLDGTNYTIITDIDGSFKIPASKIKEGKNTIYVRLHDKAENISAAQSVTYYYEPSSNYIPEIKNVTEYYGKRFISWDIEAFDEDMVSYELHRGTSSGFTPSSSTLVEDDLDETSCLYVDKEILASGTYYYKIKVKSKSSSLTFDQPYSNAKSFGNTVTAEQFANTMGQKEYLDYLEVGTPNGTAYVEKSSGNLLYSQDDFTLSNSQLDYGMSRVYNSKSKRTSMLGKGWTDSYHKEIYTSGDNLYFVDSDGSAYLFEPGEDESYACAETKDYALELTDSGYSIETKDNVIYTFNPYGQLTETTEPNGCRVIHTYDSLGRLQSVKSSESISADKVLNFVYADGEYQLDHVTDFAGTKYAYDCTGNVLKKVTVTGKESGSVSYSYVYGNASGKLETIRDGEGNAYTIAYSGEKADSIAYPDGETYKFTYSSGKTQTGKLISIGGETHTMYTLETEFDPATGKVLSVTDAVGRKTCYEYQTGGNPYLVVKEISVKGYESIADGIVTVHDDEEIVETVYTYTEDGRENLESETSSDGTVTTYEYNGNDQLISEITVNGGETLANDAYTYDANGNVTSITDHITGMVESYVYTDIDLTDEDAVAEAEEKGEDPVAPFAGNEIAVTVTEDVSIIAEEELEDDGVSVISENESGESGTAQISQSEYTYTEEERDSEENLQMVTETGNVGSVDSSGKELYDAMGRLKSSVENGVTTENEYDFLGRVVKTTVKQTSKEDVVTEYSYDGNGTLISETVTGGTTKTYTYDARNRKTSEAVSGSGMTARNSYTEYGFAEDEPVHDGITARIEDYVYVETHRNTENEITDVKYIDVSGNTVKEVEGETERHYTYDKSGNRYAEYLADSEGSASVLTLALYDDSGNAFAQISQPQISEGRYLAGEDSIVTYSGYDANSNLVSETSAAGIVTTYSYDEENRMISCTIDDQEGVEDEPDLSVEYVSTAAASQIMTITDANGNKKTETQNWNGQVTETSDISKNADEAAITVSTEYDDRGRKVKVSYSDNSFIEYEYEGDTENISKASAYKSDSVLESETTYTYDVSDRMLSAAVSKDGTNVSRTLYTYDAEGKKLTETVSYGLGSEETTAYTYDEEGRLVRTDYPEGSELEAVTYTYDTWGNLLTVSHDGKTVCEYTYDGLGQLVSMKEYKEPGESAYILRNYSYDSYGRCTSIRYLDNGSEESVLESFEYTYNQDGMILTCNHINNLPAEGNRINETRSYVYDTYGNLTQSTVTDHLNSGAESVTTYTYDKVGNRTAMSRDDQATTYTYNGLNQLTEADLPDATVNYTYDSRGNQIQEQNETTGITTSFTYAVTGEMTALSVSGSDTAAYTQENIYNHEGIRISKSEGGVTRRYYYDNGIVSYTKDGTSVSSSNILSADGDVLGTYRDSAYYTYTKDTQNSTESIIKTDGTLAAAYTYTDFGETSELTGSSFDNEICYTGAVYDAESGLYYMNARYYDPETGRFISQDTYRGSIDNPGQWHLYAYCANNPINYVDPSGHYYHNEPGDEPRVGDKDWRKNDVYLKDLRKLKRIYDKEERQTLFFNILAEIYDYGDYVTNVISFIVITGKCVKASVKVFGVANIFVFPVSKRAKKYYDDQAANAKAIANAIAKRKEGKKIILKQQIKYAKRSGFKGWIPTGKIVLSWS